MNAEKEWEGIRPGYTQGRCRPCKKAFRWNGRPLLRDALCPSCKEPLSRTSRSLKSATWSPQSPLEVVR